MVKENMMFDKFVPLTREQLVAELKALADKEELVDQSVFDDLMESVQHHHMAIATNYDGNKETILVQCRNDAFEFVTECIDGKYETCVFKTDPEDEGPMSDWDELYRFCEKDPDDVNEWWNYKRDEEY